MKKVNDMGSEVLEGFKCKPKDFDPDRPMMHYKTHIFICSGERCKRAYKSDDVATFLRELLKELKLNRGERRVKISRGGCFGACRYRSVVNIYENSKANGYLPNDNLWLKKAHLLSKEEWREIFLQLSNSKPLEETLGQEAFIKQSIF